MKWIWNDCRRQKDICLLAAGALGEEEKINLERHLAECQNCRAYYGAIKTLTAPLAAWEKSVSAIEVTPAARLRWARGVEGSGATSVVRQPLVQRVWQIIWRELIWPSRYAWGGMAALWAAMLVINGQMSEHRVNDLGGRASSSQEMMEAWEEQNRVLAELAPPAFVVPAPPPAVPGPRSQRKQDWAII
ncbi:MAG TPA: zf-HC2 domain-containing protein [Candidatus Saccharimonadales bacterium]|nr:zf-HC2 domain-containing protein [Candidatus Saccharimonadales bacterium]